MSTKKKNVGRTPMRVCVICGEQKAKGDMMRIVVSGRNTLLEQNELDETGKRKGRGAYICKLEKCIEKAYQDGMIDDDTRTMCVSDMEKSRLQMVSLVMKTGKLAAGEFQCEESIKKGEVYYVIIAEDASENTKKKFMDKCKYYDIPYIVFGLKEELGSRIGKAERSVLAVKDEQFGAQFIRRFGGNE